MSLKGKVAIVTGSTSGIGLGIARALAAEGAAILLNGFGDAGQIEAIRQEISGTYGVKATYSGADMSQPAQIARMVEDAHRELGGADILVNNAGIQFTADIEHFTAERWDAVIAINLSSAFHTMQAAIPAMKRKGWGRIINIASAHGKVASMQKAAYVAAKHGLIGLTKVAALELANAGVTANAICPGWVLTPLVQKQIDSRAERNNRSAEDEAKALLSEKQPMQAFTTPEQIGALCVYLCSAAAKTMTGAALSIDGGWTAQ